MSTQDSLAAPVQSQQPQMQPQRTSGMAIAGLVLGILGFFSSGLTSIPGIIFSVLGMRACNRSKGAVGGYGLAVAGLVTSLISMLMIFVLAAMLAGPLMNARSSALKISSISNMSQIGKACFQYGSPSYFDEEPANLEALLRADLIDEKMLINPLDNTKGYIFLPYPKGTSGAQIILVEEPGTSDGSISLLFKDGHVETVTMGVEDQKLFVQALKEHNTEELKKWQARLAGRTDFAIPGKR